jgi:PAS domain S-box-containing protein
MQNPSLKKILLLQKFIISGWLLMLFLVSPATALVKDLQFKHLTINDGLSYSWANTIIQDKYGFIWIGTDDGLNRYDGNNFHVYKNDKQDINSISSSTITKIFEDSRGVLWIGTTKGLDIYDKQNDRFIRDPRFSSERIAFIVEDVDKSLWIGALTNIYHLDFETDSVVLYSQTDISAGRIRVAGENRAMIISRRGDVWIGSSNGLHIYDKKKKSFIQIFHDKNKLNSLLSNNIRSLLEDNAGRIWIGTDAGLDLIENSGKNPTDYVFTHYINSNDLSSITEGTIRALLEDDEQNLWIGAENGLDLLDLKTFKNGVRRFLHFRNDPNKQTSLNNNLIYSLFQDRQKNIWIGTYGNGINIIVSIPDKFITYTSESGLKNSLSNNQVNCFFEDDDILWIGTGGGLNRYNRTDGTFKHYFHNPLDRKTISSNNVWSICKDRYGSLWIGTWGGGLNRFDYRSETFEHFSNNLNDTNSIGSNDIFSVIEDRDGYLWIGTMGGGLNMFDRKNKRFVRLNTQNSGIYTNFIGKILESKNGDLWLSNSSAVRFNKKTRSFERFSHSDSDSTSISSNRVICIFEDSKEHIWIGTDAGLNLLNKTTEKFTCYQKANGLQDNFINSILEDNYGNLWLGTNNGLSKFINAVNLPEKPKFKNYTYEDGLQGVGFAKRSCLRSKNGILYFGGSNGFNAFDPGKIIENTYIPPIVITDFEVFNKPINIGERGLRKDWSIDEPLVLSYKQSMFSISFAALNYISPKRNKYAYKLVGFDSDWNHIGTKNTASYMNLNPGNYVFKVIGSNNDGIWNEEGISMSIVITPPFWQTLWFGILLFIGFVGFLFWIYKWQIQFRELEVQKRMDAALSKERNLLRTLIDNVPDGIYIKDKECRKVLVNPVDVRHLGRTSEAEVLGKNDFDIYTKELAEKFYADDQKVIQTGQPVIDREEYIVDENGQKTCLLTTKVPLRDENNQIIGLVGIGRNITKRKLAEEALSQKTALLEAQLNSSVDGILIVDNQGKKILQNQRCVELWKIPKEIADNPDDQRQVDHVMLLTKKPDQFVSQIKYLYNHPNESSQDEIELKDGTVLYRYSAPIIGSDGRNYGRIWSFHDITEHKHTEKEREKLITELQDALADVKLLSGLVPICASCKKIRDDQGYWTQIESYIQDRSDAKFSHSICPDCATKLYPQYMTKIKENENPPTNEI